MIKKHVPASEIASRYGVSDETVRRMLRRGELPGVKFGRDWRCDPEAVQRALSLSNSSPERN